MNVKGALFQQTALNISILYNIFNVHYNAFGI